MNGIRAKNLALVKIVVSNFFENNFHYYILLADVNECQLLEKSERIPKYNVYMKSGKLQCKNTNGSFIILCNTYSHSDNKNICSKCIYDKKDICKEGFSLMPLSCKCTFTNI